MSEYDEYDVAVIRYNDEDSGLTFRWHGGAYIDVGTKGDDGDFYADDVINVWDDEAEVSTFEKNVWKAVPRRPFRAILEAFEERCREYLTEDPGDDAE